jgi:hypothetical protein
MPMRIAAPPVLSKKKFHPAWSRIVSQNHPIDPGAVTLSLADRFRFGPDEVIGITSRLPSCAVLGR